MGEKMMLGFSNKCPHGNVVGACDICNGENTKNQAAQKENKKEYLPRNREYYENPENVIYDLEAFAAKLGEKKTIEDLDIGNISSLEIICRNGDSVNGSLYLIFAGVKLGLQKDFKKDDISGFPETLKTLKMIAGAENKGLSFRNKTYYESPANVKSDLESFASKLGKGKIIEDLKTSNMPSLRIICHSGESAIGATYIASAGIALGLVESFRESNAKRLEILKALKRIAGIELYEYPSRDKALRCPLSSRQ